jgi:thymidylate synthase
MQHSIAEVWQNALQHVLHHGSEVSPRGQLCKELRGITLQMNDIDANIIVSPVRKLNYSFMVAEWVWMLLGRRDVASIALYNSQIKRFSDDGEVLFGAYGPKITEQLEAVIRLLDRDPDTRQAVIQIYNPAALTTVTKDVPCTLAWQFFIRGEQLELHVTMRSNDLWLGFPYDVFNFTQFQRYVAKRLGRQTGRYTHHVGSLHLYAENWPDAHLAAFARETWTAKIAAVPEIRDNADIEAVYLDALARDANVEPAEWASYAALLRRKFDKTLWLPPEVVAIYAA